MNICIIKSRRVPSDLLTPADGGTINFLKILWELEKDVRNKITILARNENNPQSKHEKFVRNVRLVYLPFERAKNLEIMERDFYEGKSFTASVNKFISNIQERIEVVHTHHWTSGLGLAPQGAFWVHTPHLLAYSKKTYIGFSCPEIIIDSERDILRHCNKIIAVSCSEKKDIKNYYSISTEKIVVIPNGVSQVFLELNNKRNYSDHQNDKFNLVTVGRIAEQKRLDVIIKAAKHLLNDGLEISLKIIGGDYFNQDYFLYIQQTIKLYGLSEHILITGYLKQDEISDIYKKSDIYIQSSLYESQGIAIIEAMAAGLPIITTYHEAFEEYFIEGINGYFYNGDDTSQLIQKIKLILLNKKLKARISKNNKTKGQTFKWKNCVDKTINLLLPHYVTGKSLKALDGAKRIGKNLLKIPQIKEIAVTGSVAKGKTWSGSDLDFVAICNEVYKKEDFFYSKKGDSINIHYISEAFVNRILRCNDNKKLAVLLSLNNRGAYLCQSIPILSLGNLLFPCLVNKINRIIIEPEFVEETVNIYDRLYRKHISLAKAYIEEGFLLQAHLEIRRAVFYLSIKLKIAKGWVLRGSKKRPEQLKEYCQEDKEINFYEYYKTVNNINCLNIIDILKLTKLRYKLRIHYLNFLMLMRDRISHDKMEFVKTEIEHNKHAANYYMENLYAGYELGAIYHIRNISGLPKLVRNIYYLLNGNKEDPIDEIVQCPRIDREIKENWLEVMGLDASEFKINHYLETIDQMITKL